MDFMDILGYLLIGLVAGWLASLIVRGRGMGLLGDVATGIVGALIGGLVFNALNITLFANDVLTSFAAALVGSVILLAIVLALSPRQEVLEDF